MSSFSSDLRFVLRSLAKSPLFVVVALTSLALGVGGNSAIFGLLDQVMLRSLPVRDPAKLVLLRWAGDFQGMIMSDHAPFSFPMYKDIRDRSGSAFETVAARFSTVAAVRRNRVAERATVELVSGTYFETFGVQPAIGRLITPAEDRVRDAEPYVVLSYGYWQRQFGSDGSVLNSTLEINGHPFTVIGVAARAFRGPDIATPADVFVPLMMKNAMTPTWDKMDDRACAWLQLYARLLPGVSLAKAQNVAGAIYHTSQIEDLKVMPDVTTHFRTSYLRNSFQLQEGGRGASGLRDQFAIPLLMLMGMVGTLLLIACGNVANLMVARAAARQREFAIRLTLGATRRTVMRLVLIESTILTLGGSICGLLLAWWTSSLLIGTLPFANTGAAFSSTPDHRVLLFTLSVSAITALIFGAIPAVQATKPDLAPALKNESTSVVGGKHVLLRKGLVAAQICLSLLLLLGTGLFARSFYKLMNVDPGLTTRHVLTFSIDPSLAGYKAEKIWQTFGNLQTRFRTLPGVEGVSGSMNALLTQNNWIMSTRADDYAGKEGEDLNPSVNAVLPGFFATLKMRMLTGRDFTDADVLRAPHVAIVNEQFARFFYPHESPIGHRIGFGSPKTAKLDMLIVGVVNDSKGNDLKEKPTRYVYLPIYQWADPNSLTFYVRTVGDPSVAESAIRHQMSAYDSGLPIYDMKSFDMQVAETHYIDRLVFLLSAGFGLLATLLAAFGLYGVMAFVVTRRTRELGLRMALGAQQAAVLRQVLAEVMLLTGIGIAVALPMAFGLGRLIQSQLYQVQANDPLTMIAAVILLLGVGASAGYVPALRASRIDPIQALRWE